MKIETDFSSKFADMLFEDVGEELQFVYHFHQILLQKNYQCNDKSEQELLSRQHVLREKQIRRNHTILLTNQQKWQEYELLSSHNIFHGKYHLLGSFLLKEILPYCDLLGHLETQLAVP